MSIDNLYDFFKKINYKRILPVLLCPVLFLCTSISGFALDVSPDLNEGWFLIPFNFYLNENKVADFDDVSGAFNVLNTSGSNIYYNITSDYSGGVFPVLTEGHEYLVYLTFSVHSDELVPFDHFKIINSLNDTSGFFFFNSSSLFFDVSYSADTTSYVFLDSFVYNNQFVFSNLSGLVVTSSSAVRHSGRVSWGLYFRDITNNSYDEVNQIIAAINNQTTQQNNNFNNFMGSGSQFGGTTSGILSGNDELSEYIDDYTQIEQTMHNNFESAQSALIGDFTGFTWGSLANTLNWTSDYMQQIYLNSGDFKMMIILPLLLGIALFFIGRGAIILSNSNKDN